jgi:myo-inositol 2-dehydrogenase/D-chiro-inositol 1-dehydrogenase
MNFALVGDDPAVLPLLEAATAAGHRVIQAALADRLLTSHPEWSSVPRCSWEELLVSPAVEAVIVAGDSDDVQTAAKQLAAVGKPLLVLPRVALGTACAYELSLIRDDSRVEIMPAYWLRFTPECVSLALRIAAGELGAVRRLQVDRELPGADSAAGLTESEIEAASLDDIDLLQWLGGRYDQVTALRSGRIAQGHSQATLTLTGPGLPDATWNARRGANATWRLTVETDCGPLTLDHPVATGAPASMIAAFVGPRSPQHPTWSDAVRVFDVLDGARRSLRRRRTIDLHFETLSERQQFKTQMTAIGCGMLMLTLVLMLALLGLGAMLESRDRAVREAEAAGLLLQASDFESLAAVLTPAAAARLEGIAERLKDEPKSVYLEPSHDPPNPELDQRRRAKIVERLANLGVEAADHRTLFAAIRSTGWDTLMRVLRLAWIAPLLLFLVLQGLILVAKPTAARPS